MNYIVRWVITANGTGTFAFHFNNQDDAKSKYDEIIKVSHQASLSFKDTNGKENRLEGWAPHDPQGIFDDNL